MTILVADDEFAMLSVLSLALEGEGFDVIRAGDGAEALLLARAHRPRLILADATMPVMGGRELLAALRADEVCKDVPFILMVNSYEHRQEEGVPTLRKPFSLTSLLELLRREIEHPASRP